MNERINDFDRVKIRNACCLVAKQISHINGVFVKPFISVSVYMHILTRVKFLLEESVS